MSFRTFRTISYSGLRKLLESSNSPCRINSRNEVFPKKPGKNYIFKMGKPVPLATLNKGVLDANMDYVGNTSFLEENCKLASYLSNQFQRLKIGHAIYAGPRTPEQEQRFEQIKRDMRMSLDQYYR